MNESNNQNNDPKQFYENKTKCGGDNQKYFIKTFGCQMNVHDSEKIAGIFAESGYDQSEDRNNADVIVLNTCSIRQKAEQKFYSEIGRLKNKHLKILPKDFLDKQGRVSPQHLSAVIAAIANIPVEIADEIDVEDTYKIAGELESFFGTTQMKTGKN